MLLMYGIEGDENGAPEQVVPAAEPEEPCWAPWQREMSSRPVMLIGGGRLQPSTTATTVRASGSEVLVADGPFAETKEQVLGFDIIECADLDEAIHVASRHPVAQHGGAVEVRPVLEMPDHPAQPELTIGS
ncbi:MAG TPA: YciI family protein [Streptosporangiaceae bacterium]